METPPRHLWLRRGAVWQCPACGKQYPRAGQVHSCVVVPLDHHFRDRPQHELPGQGIACEFQDHGIAHSIYFCDPDGHQIEITTYDL